MEWKEVWRAEAPDQATWRKEDPVNKGHKKIKKLEKDIFVLDAPFRYKSASVHFGFWMHSVQANIELREGFAGLNIELVWGFWGFFLGGFVLVCFFFLFGLVWFSCCFVGFFVFYFWLFFCWFHCVSFPPNPSFWSKDKTIYSFKSLTDADFSYYISHMLRQGRKSLQEKNLSS